MMMASMGSGIKVWKNHFKQPFMELCVCLGKDLLPLQHFQPSTCYLTDQAARHTLKFKPRASSMQQLWVSSKFQRQTRRA